MGLEGSLRRDKASALLQERYIKRVATETPDLIVAEATDAPVDDEDASPTTVVHADVDETTIDPTSSSKTISADKRKEK
jgi:hypothetical protein